MSPTADQLLAAAMALPQPDRFELASRLMDSMDATEHGGFATPEIAAAWDEEIARRIKEADEGNVPSIPAEEVHRMLSEKYPFFED
jgi:putative addiction module component (TIGR02574 family)